MARRLVVLTGAGISAESGVPTFRADDGLWEGHRVEDVATPEAFAANPGLVQDFYNKRRALLPTVHPNAAHRALAELAARWDGPFLLVTQNVDDLHDRAHADISPGPGFELIHMHGELLKARCTATDQVWDWREDLDPYHDSPLSSDGWLRPHIVWFGEMPLEMPRIYAALERCDLRFHRHLGGRLSGSWFRPRGPIGRGADGGNQSGAVPGSQCVRRASLWPGHRGGAAVSSDA